MKKDIEIKRKDFLAKSSDSYKSVKTGCLNFLNLYRFSAAKLEQLSITRIFFPTLDANGMKDAILKKKIA